MQRISSKSTFIAKRVFPVVWLGFIAIFLAALLFPGPGPRETFPFVLVPIFAGLVGYFVMKKLVFDLVDEVWDGGDYLLVKNKGAEERIRLENIVNLSYSAFSNPQRATLKLRTAGRFGSEVTFVPVSKLLPFSRNEMIDKLIDRIDAARRRS